MRVTVTGDWIAVSCEPHGHVMNLGLALAVSSTGPPPIPTLYPVLASHALLLLYLAIRFLGFYLNPRWAGGLKLLIVAFTVALLAAIFATERADWVRLIPIIFWLAALIVVFLFRRKLGYRGDPRAFLVIGSVVTATLICILFGVQRLATSSGRQRDFGFAILILLLLCLPLLWKLETEESNGKKSDL